MFLLKHPLQGQSIWIRDIAHALDISSDQVIAAVDCLGWNSERKKWLQGGKTAPRLEVADPMQLGHWLRRFPMLRPFLRYRKRVLLA